MKITLANNSELVITARNDKDYQQALLVAAEMEANGWVECSIAAVCHVEFFVHICAVDDSKQKENFVNDYKAAKKIVTGKK